MRDLKTVGCTDSSRSNYNRSIKYYNRSRNSLSDRKWSDTHFQDLSEVDFARSRAVFKKNC